MVKIMQIFNIYDVLPVISFDGTVKIPNKIIPIEDHLTGNDTTFNPPQPEDKIDKLRGLFGSDGLEGREGLGKIRTHLKQERNTGLVRKCKEDWRKSNGGKMPCLICDKDLEEEYEGLKTGKYGCLEAHHTILLSASKEDRTTKQDDLVILCPNCHSIAHMNINSKTVYEIKLLLKSQC